MLTHSFLERSTKVSKAKATAKAKAKAWQNHVSKSLIIVSYVLTIIQNNSYSTTFGIKTIALPISDKKGC